MRSRVVLLLLPLAFLLSAPLAARAKGPKKLVFDTNATEGGGRSPGRAKAHAVGVMPAAVSVTVRSETAAAVVADGFEVTLDLVAGEERRRFVSAALGRDLDPFETLDRLQKELDVAAAGSGRPGVSGFSMVTVLMSVRNKSGGTLVFNPQNIVLMTDRPDFLEPLDATRAYELFRAAGLQPDEFMSDLHRALYDTSPSLRPGESVSGLLAYAKPRPEIKKATLDFSFFSIDSEPFSFGVPMRQIEWRAPEAGASPGEPGEGR